ncbi:GntR family transcriptional regulator [Lacticaseibacillus nasuensis]|uniref:Transcription regulator n=1 Tax=Lacticaseibacillus nasuensis JCM 17158 TaxID=1291734 RepID=A0A0R1K019_9LACO|nr:GntR family transcriptional regulator [Lacticaseibacillus nasuensis]KRK73985.1 transcription regulator [Lacticaseibacillus nasuensis JCM 17158]
MAKYQDLFNRLKMAILRGEYAPNQRLPSENALAIRYRLSRITTKRALNELVAADLVYRVQGKGTFVKPHTSTASRDLLLVLPFTDPRQFGDYQSGITQTLRGTTWQLTTITNPTFAKLSPADLREQYAGVIYYPEQLGVELPHLIAIFENGLPLVLLDKRPGALAVPSIISDNAEGGALALHHLQQLGHRRIAFYPGHPFWESYTDTVSDRFFGYLNAYRGLAPSAEPLHWAQALYGAPAEQIRDFLQAHHITGIIAENDLEALKLMHGLQRIDAPFAAKLSVIGFDDLPAAAQNTPPLTTIVQDFPAMGTEAVTALLSQINNPTKLFNQPVTVPVKLVARQSTKPKGESNADF